MQQSDDFWPRQAFLSISKGRYRCDPRPGHDGQVSEPEPFRLTGEWLKSAAWKLIGQSVRRSRRFLAAWEGSR